MEIVTRKFSFQSKYDNVPIHGTCMIPEQPIGILQMVHGMSEHKERYISFMENMAQKGYITLMHDNRGHGMSVIDKEDIGYCYESREKGFVEDIFAVTKKVRKEFPDLPLILYGHSMGSLAVRAYILKHDDAINGLIVSGCPGYNSGVPFGKFLVRMCAGVRGMRYRSLFMQNLVIGSFEKRFRKEGRKNAWLAAKESVAEEFLADPFCTFVYTLNGFLTLLNLESLVYKKGGCRIKNPDLPILFLSGKEDPCYMNERKWNQAVSRMRSLGYHDIKEIRYEGMRHEIHNEDERDKVFHDIDSFCQSVISGR